MCETDWNITVIACCHRTVRMQNPFSVMNSKFFRLSLHVHYCSTITFHIGHRFQTDFSLIAVRQWHNVDFMRNTFFISIGFVHRTVFYWCDFDAFREMPQKMVPFKSGNSNWKCCNYSIQLMLSISRSNWFSVWWRILESHPCKIDC